ncbi:hypothetical protein BX661DRAFT_197080 [Kickxella alabastrina]|uniref:uncharacterized protein n=1 Tax=Kickxella alabastrina TaxID=61397 RepID=UPI00221E49FA|nr:uncharacterized protein BX661DRAFT_197080 [Kickxella alabastrina]KAI7831853.1 hypothetical protein BX661DRAFT_197080 [Kickxella alabastrina]
MYKLKVQAKVFEVIDTTPKDPAPTKNSQQTFLPLTLDQKLFYPQGGGQPTDIGIITSPTASSKPTTSSSTMKPYANGRLYSGWQNQTNDIVMPNVNEETRLRNAGVIPVATSCLACSSHIMPMGRM